jgi:ureidoacrylate peracid hydrolase
MASSRAWSTANHSGRGAGGAQIVDALKPEPSDIVIEGKRGLCGFATTNLDFILRSRGISTIALGGFLTNCCVESTMRTGYEKGYDVVTLKDCTATVSEDEQQAAFDKNFLMFSKPMTHDEFLSGLKSGKAVETKSRGDEAA